MTVIASTLMLRDRSVLLGVSGSIAAYKAVEIARLLVKEGAKVQVIMTEAAQAFVGPLTFRAITGQPVVTRWDDPLQTEIGHVEQGYRANVGVVAPATAQTLARLALGLADDALAATLLSFDGPLVLAPAMETRMWSHPATRANVATLRSRGATFVGPDSGPLASGRTGQGRLAEPEAVVAAVVAAAGPRDLDGMRLLLTAGPTWEPLDPVRLLTSRATGTFGVRLAEAAAFRGAEVTLVLGPTSVAPVPAPNLWVVRVESAEQMRAAVQQHLSECSAFIATAAVSDFRPAEAQARKLKRADGAARRLELVENPDILAEAARALAAPGAPTVVVGFAAETEDVERNAREKLARKGCDFVVANRVGVDRGFGPAETEVAWIGPDVCASFGPGSKADAAAFVLDRLAPVIRERQRDHG